jgi:uncharacterized protein YfdQ (DUF2303 family)
MPATMKAEVMTAALDAKEKRAPHPRRKKGTATLMDEESFIAHVAHHRTAETVIFGSTKDMSFSAVHNYSEMSNGQAGWGDHRSVYACVRSDAFDVWVKNSGVDMSQEAFATFLEDNLKDVANPDEKKDPGAAKPAELVDMARKLSIHTKGEFTREVNPTTGEHNLVSRLEHDAKSTRIFKYFLLRLPVFESGSLYVVEARVGFKLESGSKPKFSYTLKHLNDVVLAAYNDVKSRVVAATGVPFFTGRPE